MKALLEGGADKDAEANNGLTPLYVAVWTGQVDCLKALLKGGAAIDAKTKDGETPLHAAAWKDQLDCLKALLVGGAAIEAEDKDGETPLHHAARHGKVDCLKVLLKGGAAIEAEAKNGSSVFTLAKANERWNVLAVLKEYDDRQEEVKVEKEGSLLIDNIEFKVPAQFFKVSGTLKDLFDDVNTKQEVPLKEVSYKLWQLLDGKIESISQTALMVEYLKSVGGELFIASPYYTTIKKEFIDHYAQYTKEQVVQLLALANYLNIPFLLDCFADTYAQMICIEMIKPVHKDLKASVIKAAGIFLKKRANKQS